MTEGMAGYDPGSLGAPGVTRPLRARSSRGGGAFVPAEFDLFAYSGTDIQIRFRIGFDCGNCDVEEGWYIDDVAVQ